MRLHYTFKRGLLIFSFVGLLAACEKDKTFDNPYAGGKEALGIQLSTDLPSPSTGIIGSVVTFKAKGLLPYKDSIHFFLNNEPAQIMSVDSSSIQVKVPPAASTGIGSLTIGDQIYFGSLFKVQGDLAIDNTFKANVGSNSSINDVLQLPDGKLIMVGGFSDFEHKGAVKPINRIVLTSKDGEVDRSLKSGTAVDGYLTSIAALPDNKMVIGGGFSSYDSHRGEINGISVLNKNGSLDTVVVRTFLSLDTIPAFNGGVNGSIQKVFTHGNTITAVGYFSYYLQQIYGKPNYNRQRDTLITDSVIVRNIVRFFPDGSLDSSFNYNFQYHMSNIGPNGPILDGYMQDDGKLIIVGRFSKYNGETVNNIVRLNEDGTIDRSFKVGNGANNSIVSIKYNATTHHFMLAGPFTQFAGENHYGLVMMNADGTVDESFSPVPLGNEYAYTFAQQLSNNMIIVSGYFKSYNGIHRGNFMVLNSKGDLAKGYNTTGDLHGTVSQILETTSATGKVQVLLTGSFYKFDEQSVGNVTRVIFNK